MRWLSSLLAVLALAARPATAQTPGSPSTAAEPLIVILMPTGVDRDGLPVYAHHRNAADYAAVLSRGFSGRLLRLYRWEQQFLARRDGRQVEPAYLLISKNEGGFPRFGFWLDDVRKAGVGYVDLSHRLDGSGRFGALDQIFPHELMHVIVQQLAGVPPRGTSGANQVHAIGVRTDRVTAFDEGFAEHAQVMALDDSDARPLTAALARDRTLPAIAELRLERYRRSLEALWVPAPPARMSFLLWFSQTEQVLRYHAVKANRFAHEPVFRMHDRAGDLYAAYLLENVLPGDLAAPLKPTPRLLETEGVIASLFSRWVATPAMQEPDPALDARFGATPADIEPIAHAYLKIWSVLADARPHEAAEFVRAYVTAFPAEEAAVADLVRRTGLAWPLPEVPELWVANDAFMTGTTMFDQYRAQPRVHTFDVNAASIVDLMGVSGVSTGLAEAIQRSGPYSTVDDLARVPRVTPAIVERFRVMAGAMAAVRAANASHDIESLDLMALLRPVMVRAAIWTLVSAVAAGWLYRRLRVVRMWRLAVNGFAAALVGVVPAWIVGTSLQIGDRPVEPAWFVLGPVVIFGVPAALWELSRRRSLAPAGRVLAAWALTCVPAVLITVPII